MIDDFEALAARDEGGFLTRLASLPGSYDGPDGRQPEPYGVMAFGEASLLPSLLAPWVDGTMVGEGTQFLLASGFDFGEVAALRLAAEVGGAAPIVIGDAAYQPSFRVAAGTLSPYVHVSYLAYATGHAEALAAAEARMRDLAPQLAKDVPTELNPAKRLAWALWNRVPLLLSPRALVPLQALVQQVLARVGKTLSVTAGAHPSAVAAAAFEGRHQLGDDVVGLVLGAEDRELELVREVLATRVAQVENLAEQVGDPIAGLGDTVAQALVLWYLSVWVAAYLALLHGFDPSDDDVYGRVRDSAEASAG